MKGLLFGVSDMMRNLLRSDSVGSSRVDMMRRERREGVTRRRYHKIGIPKTQNNFPASTSYR